MSPELVVVFTVLAVTAMCNLASRSSLVTRGLYLLSASLLIALAGLRAESVGRDYVVYREYFESSPTVLGRGFLGMWAESLARVDVFYVYLNSLVKRMGLPYEAFIFLVAFFVVGLYSIFFRRHCKLYALAFILYFSHMFFYREMIQIRAGLACVLVLWTFHHWAEGQRMKGALLFLVASLTHLSVTIALAPLALYSLGYRLRTRSLVMTLSVALVLGYYVTSSFPLFSQLDRLAIYQDSIYSEAVGIFSNPVTVKQLGILAVSWWLMRTRGQDTFSPVFRICLLSYWVSTLWIISFNQFSILGARGASFLSMGEPLIMADIVAVFYQDSALRRFRTVAASGTLAFALLMFVLNLHVKNVLVNEYRSIFQ